MMKELLYPFDADYILTKKKSIKRQLLADGSERISKKIAILGGSTTNNIKLIMELFLLNLGIAPEFYESEYNQYYEDAVFGNPELDEFKPDLVYICTTNRNVTSYPAMSQSAADVDAMLAAETAKFKAIWAGIESRYGCPIIQNNFEMPLYRLLGNKDATDIHGKVNYLTRLNMEFAAHAQESKN